MDESDLVWFQATSLNSLKSLAKLHLNVDMNKSARDVFMHGNINEIRENIQSLITYCANDVAITHKIYKNIFPKFLAKKTRGNYVTFGGLMELGTSYLPISKEWENYISRCETIAEEKRSKIGLRLKELAEK